MPNNELTPRWWEHPEVALQPLETIVKFLQNSVLDARYVDGVAPSLAVKTRAGDLEVHNLMEVFDLNTAASFGRLKPFIQLYLDSKQPQWYIFTMDMFYTPFKGAAVNYGNILDMPPDDRSEIIMMTHNTRGNPNPKTSCADVVYEDGHKAVTKDWWNWEPEDDNSGPSGIEIGEYVW